MKTVNKKSYNMILLICAGLLLVGMLLFVNIKKTDTLAQANRAAVLDGSKNIQVAGTVAAVSESGSRIYCIEDVLVEAQGDTIKGRNMSGNSSWHLNLEGEIIKAAATANRIILIDDKNKLYCVSKQGKLLWAYLLGYGNADVFAEDNGMLLMEYNSGSSSIIEVFNPKGTKIASLNIENSRVLSFSSILDKCFSIAILDLSDDSVKSKIITYNLKGEIVWADNYDKEVISMVNYNKNNALLAVNEDTLYSYKTEGKKNKTVELKSKILHIGANKYGLGILSMEKGKIVFSAYDSTLKSLFAFEAAEISEGVPENIRVGKNHFFLFNRAQLLIYDMKGKLAGSFKANVDINDVIVSEAEAVYIVSNRKLQKLTF